MIPFMLIIIDKAKEIIAWQVREKIIRYCQEEKKKDKRVSLNLRTGMNT